MSPPDPIACALFVIAAFTLAGVAQTIWFAMPSSRALALPLDFGLMLRGRRLFGDNKTVRGFVVMVPAVAMAFAMLAILVDGRNPGSTRLWTLSPLEYALLGGWAGLGFMAGELPNSFVKRQLGIAPGGASRGRAFLVQLVVDRLDSGIGMLTALSVAVPTPWQTWAVVLTIGPFLHGAFSVVMFHLGVKPRLA
jgi:hypothetical protein